MVFHRKSNLTKLYKERSYRWSFNGIKTIVEQRTVDMTEFKQKVSIKKAVIAESRNGKLSVKDIAKGIEGNQGSVKTTLNRLKQRGLVVKLNATTWELTARVDKV